MNVVEWRMRVTERERESDMQWISQATETTNNMSFVTTHTQLSGEYTLPQAREIDSSSSYNSLLVNQTAALI